MNHKMITSLISALVVITIDVACSVEQEWTMFHLTGRDAVLFVLFSFSFLFYIYLVFLFVLLCAFLLLLIVLLLFLLSLCVCVWWWWWGVVIVVVVVCLLLLLFRGVVVFVIIVSFRSCGLWTVHCLAILPLHCFLLQCNGL